MVFCNFGGEKLDRHLHESDAARGELDACLGEFCDPCFRIVDTRYGQLNVTINDDDLIGRFLTETGEWAFDEASFIASTLNDGARVLDGGAFLGTFGLGVALRRKLGLLCAVEANPLVLPLLEANLRRNARATSEVIGALLAGPAGSPRIGHANPGNLGSVSFCEDAIGDDCLPEPEEVVTLETLRERYGAFDLIKLDIEGMEREVLLGDEEHLSRGLTTLWLECNEHARSLDVLDLVLSWGVEVHYFAFPSHNPDNFRRLLKPILPWAYEAGLLVAPGRPPVLDAEFAAHGCILRPVASREALEEAMWLTPRGLPDELAVADAPTLAAIASRALRGQERSSFLHTGLAENVWQRLAATQEGLACAENLAVSRLTEIEEERRIRSVAEDLAVSRLAEIEEERRIRSAAEDLAVSRLAEIEEERFLRANAEERLAEATSLALGRLASLGEERDRTIFAEAAAEAAAAQLASTNAQLASTNAQLASTNAQLESTNAQLASTNAQLATIQMTLGWRLVARVNRFVASRQKLHRVLRSGRVAAGMLLGRR